MLRLRLSVDRRRLALHQCIGRAGKRAARGAVARQQRRSRDAGADRGTGHCRLAGLHRWRCDQIRRGGSDPERLEAARRRGASGDAARRPTPRTRRGAGGVFDKAVCEGEETGFVSLIGGDRHLRASASPPFVMAWLDPAIPRLSCLMRPRTWMPGTRPGMTTDYKALRLHRKPFTHRANHAAMLLLVVSSGWPIWLPKSSQP